MQKRRITNHLIVSLAAILTASCAISPPPTQQYFTNLYQHQWIDTASPHKPLSITDIADLVADYDVVFFGEFHRHPGVHLAQMQLFEAMHKRNPDLSLSLEQFERDTQPYVDDYLAGRIGEKYLRSQARAWDNYPTSYRPLVEFAKQNGLPVIAANAPKTAVICVGRKGLQVLDAMPASARQHVATNVDVSAGKYRDKFLAFLTHSPSHGASSNDKNNEIMRKMGERSFSAQALRDDTMAESIARHIKQNPNRQILHLNGSFHSASFLGTVERLSKRMPELKIAVINPITLGADKTTWSNEDLTTGSMLLLVGELPQGFIQESHEQEWSRKILKKRMDNDCPY